MDNYREKFFLVITSNKSQKFLSINKEILFIGENLSPAHQIIYSTILITQVEQTKLKTILPLCTYKTVSVSALFCTSMNYCCLRFAAVWTVYFSNYRPGLNINFINQIIAFMAKPFHLNGLAFKNQNIAGKFYLNPKITGQSNNY